jgi:hypothetical protein
MAPQRASQAPVRALPIRASTRPPKPSAKKRSPSPSQHAPRRSKKPKAHSSAISTIPEPLLSTQNNAKLIEISDKEEEDEEEDNDVDEEEDIEDDDAEEEEEEARLFKFKTTWKALCGKEQLPGIQSAYFIRGALYMIDIELWKKKVLQDLQPRSFRVVSLLATASHEKCRQADEFPQELSSSLDLDTVLNCLEEWHKQWPQRTLTLRVTLQLEEEKLAPAILAAPQSTQAQACCTATQA